MARTLIQRMRQERAALFVQRNWRGLMGRRRYAMKRKEEWAVRLYDVVFMMLVVLVVYLEVLIEGYKDMLVELGVLN